MNRIDSKENKKIKRLKSLDRKKVRDKENLFFIEGRKLLDEAYKSKITITEIYVSDSYYQKNMSYIDKLMCSEKYVLADNLLKSLSYMSSPEGVLALAKPMKWDILEVLKKGQLVVVMDRISDPGNVGTIIRSGEAFGIGCVFGLEGCADLYNEKTIRASMGSLFRVPYIKISDEIFSILKKAEYEIYGLDAKGDDIESIKLNRRCALVIGNESQGLDKSTKKHINRNISVKMLGMTESLNAAVAASIVMYRLMP